MNQKQSLRHQEHGTEMVFSPTLGSRDVGGEFPRNLRARGGLRLKKESELAVMTESLALALSLTHPRPLGT